MTTRIITGLKPTGQLTLGNYLGALTPLRALAARPGTELLVFVADLHALTIEHDPAELRARTLEMAATLLAAGVAERATLFVQSSLPAHSELAGLLSSTALVGETRRMVQFKEKSRESDAVRLALLTYPVLMAADILVHGAELVPVGDDQRQHLELTRDIALRFNARYGETFVVPQAVVHPDAARIKDLRDPTAKMGKSGADGSGVIYLADSTDVVAAKVRRAVTDADPSLVYDPENRPGVANLAILLGALSGTSPEAALAGLRGAAALKRAVTDAVVATLEPLQERLRLIQGDPGSLYHRLQEGAESAAPRTLNTLERAREALGLVHVRT